MSKTVNGTTTGQVWDLAEGMPLLIKDGAVKYVTGAGGLPLEEVGGSTVLYYYQDQAGSTRFLLSSTGSLVASYTYDPYGNVISQTGTVSNPFRYDGQYTDPQSGLQYLRNRYYDSATTQFLTVDPLASVTGQPYSYAGDDPLNVGDPAGLCRAGPISVPIGGSENCSDDAGSAVINNLPRHRLPDYVTGGVNVGIPVFIGPVPVPVVVGGSCQLSRSGEMFCGGMLGLGTPGVSPSVGAGWLDSNHPSPCQVDNFINGPSVQGGAGAGLVPVGVWGNPPNVRGGQTGGEWLISRPGAWVGVSDAWPWHRFPVHW